MKQPVDFARAYLQLADRDINIKALELLIRAREIDDETIGFHAQQSVEKCLKAVLASSSIPFRKTHDLQELMDLLIDHNKPLPPNADKLDILNPYAVLMRYDFMELGGDRKARPMVACFFKKGKSLMVKTPYDDEEPLLLSRKELYRIGKMMNKRTKRTSKLH